MSERTTGTGYGLPAGVYGALATPLDSSHNIDHAALDRLVARMVDAGAAGVSPVGSTGEGPRLTAVQRLTVIGRVCRQVPRNLPVIPGVAVTSVAEALADLDRAAWAGATAALVSPPSYYRLDDADVLRLYQQLADATPLPLLLYNIPVFTKTRISPEVAAQLADHLMIAGIKDSSGDLEYFVKLVAATRGAPGFSVFTGTDRILLTALEAGAHGAIAASLNIAPRLSVGVYRDYAAGAVSPETIRAQQTLADLVEACRVGDFPTGWKSAMHYTGVAWPYPAPPAESLGEDLQRELWRRLTELGIEH